MALSVVVQATAGCWQGFRVNHCWGELVGCQRFCVNKFFLAYVLSSAFNPKASLMYSFHPG